MENQQNNEMKMNFKIIKKNNNFGKSQQTFNNLPNLK